MENIFKVEHPIHQSSRELIEKYSGNWVIMGDFEKEKSGGIVIYYSPDRKLLNEKIMKLDEESEIYHDYNVRYIGRSRSINASGGLFL